MSPRLATATPPDDTATILTAVRDLHESLSALAPDVGPVPPGVPPLIHLGLADTAARWLAGTGTTCEHDPGPSAVPVHAAARVPGLVVCGRCRHRLHPPGGPLRCDACGTAVGVEPGDRLGACRLRVGPLHYAAEVCCDCSWEPR